MENLSREPTAKGTAFLGAFKFIKTQPRWLALLEKVLAQLAPESALALKRKIIAVADYPYALYVDLIRTADKVIGSGDLSVCRQIGFFSAKRDYESIYNLYKQNPRPEDLFRDSNVIWRSYYQNAGELKAADTSFDHLVMQILNFPAMDLAHCALMGGWMVQALIESGGLWTQEIREVKCTSRGDAHHEFMGRWKRAGT